MKSKLLITALIAAFSLPVFAQAPVAGPVNQLRQDKQEVRRDNHEIGRDKHDIARDKVELHQQRAQRNADQRAEDRAVKHGNVAAAQKLESQRERQQQAINHEKRDLRQDRKVLHTDRLARAGDVKERNQDARAIR